MAKIKRTKHTHTTKDRVTRTPLKTGGKLRCSGRLFKDHLKLNQVVIDFTQIDCCQKPYMHLPKKVKLQVIRVNTIFNNLTVL